MSIGVCTPLAGIVSYAQENMTQPVDTDCGKRSNLCTAQHLLFIPQVEQYRLCLSVQCHWLLYTQVLAPHRRVLFLDTDSMPAPEVRAGDALSNPREAAIVIDIVKALDLGRVSLDDIGIISPYRAQVGTSFLLSEYAACHAPYR